LLSWVIPPEATTKSGTLQCVISIYDKFDEKIKYQWSTAPFTNLSIGATLENVDASLPEKDKILLVNTKTRTISTPAGYDTQIAMRGDVGITKIYF
jgi:hypothetical protein